MYRRSSILLIALLALVALPAAAQSIDYDNTDGWSATIADGGNRDGARELDVSLVVEPGHYVYRWMSLAGTKRDKINIELKSDGGDIEILGIDFPDAHEKHDETLDADVATYATGTVKIPVRARLASKAAQTVTATVRAQACTTGRPGGDFCKMPQTHTVTVALEALASIPAPTERATPTSAAATSPTAAPTVTQVASTDTPAPSPTPAKALPAPGGGGERPSFFSLLSDERGVQKMLAQGLFWFLLFVFVGGLAVNLTPCVYPLIPITVSVIGASGAKTRSRAFTLAVSYVVGMSIVNAALGVIAGLTGHRLGFIFTYPPVIFVVAILLFVFAFGMFGAFDLTLPAALQTKLMKATSADSVGGGHGGVFLMGLASGVIASPCSTPVLGGLATVIVAGQVGAVRGFVFMMVFSLGMGLPFLVLGTFSGLLASLPRSGRWMNAVKYVMGTGLLIGAYYFLGLVLKDWQYDLALGAGLVAAAVFLGLGVTLPAEAGTGARLQKAGGILAAAAGVYFFVAGLGAAGFGPALPLGNSRVAPVESGIAWRRVEPVALAEASTAGMPVFIDFFTDECKPCKQLDRETFSHPEVQALATSFVPTKLDLTVKPWTTDEQQAEISRLEKKYQIRGVPRVMFLNADGEVIEGLTLTGFEKPEKFRLRLERALACAAAPEPTLLCRAGG